MEIATEQVRLSKVCLAEVCSTQVRPVEVRSTEVRTTEVYQTQIRLDEICLVKVGLDQVWSNLYLFLSPLVSLLDPLPKDLEMFRVRHGRATSLASVMPPG